MTYNPPVLTLAAIGGSGATSSSLGTDGFRISLVDDMIGGLPGLSRAGDSAAAAAAAATDVSASSTHTSSSSGGAADFDRMKEEFSSGERFASSIAACTEIQVAFDADFTEEWMPVTVQVMQLDLTSAFASNACVYP